MAERRMFAKTIIDSDAFLDMPLSSQALYFHLSMRADDDGFNNNPKKVQRMIGASDDDLKLLVIKKFIIPFDNGIIVIKHWKIHNYIQKDRYKETLYTKQKQQLIQEKNGVYELKSESLDTDCIQDANKVYTEDKLSKDKLSKDNNIDKLSSSESNSDPELEKKQKSQKIPYEKIVDYLNRKTNSHYRPTSKATRRLIKARYNEGFTDMDFKTVIDKKCAEWLQDGNMVQYLRPETLFGTKFEAYLNQPDTGSIPRRNYGSKPVRKATDWDELQRKQEAKNQNISPEERQAQDEWVQQVFREFGSGGSYAK